MAAAKGNTNAVGNSGGKEWGKKNRNKAATLKGLVMDDAIKIMRSKSKTKEMTKKKELVMSKILPVAVPRELDIGNKDNKPFELSITDEQSKKIAKQILEEGERKGNIKSS